MAWMVLCGGLFVAVLLGVAVWLGLRSAGPDRSDPRPDKPEHLEDLPYHILRRRYAAGEIDEDEYLRRLSGLSQQ